MPVIAVDLGGTKVASALVAEDGGILARDHALLGGRGGDEVAALVAIQCDALIAHGRARGTALPTAVGVAVPGIYRPRKGTVWAPNIPGWGDFPLRDELQRALGPAIRVTIDSDRAACILGETWCGAAVGARDAIFVTVGTGIGAGILVDGRVMRGHADIAGALGWLALDRPFVERWTRCGCFEYNASGPGLTNLARDLLEQHPDYRDTPRRLHTDDLSTARLFEAYDQGDELAVRVMNEATEFWGMATANLVSLFNPEKIVFGGGVFGPAVRFLDQIHAEARRWAQPIAMQQVSLVASALGGDAGLYGAARLAMDVAVMS